jgi:hypothetical protein
VEERVDVEGHPDVLVEPCGERSLPILRASIGGERNRGCARVRLFHRPELANQLEAIGGGHAKVGDDEIRGAFADGAQALGNVLCRHHVRSDRSQHVDDQIA